MIPTRLKRIAGLTITVMAAVSLSSCIAYRAVRYGAPGIDDYRTFPQDTIHKGEQTFEFAETPHEKRLFDTLRAFRSYGELRTIHEALEAENRKKNLSCGILIIRNDSVIYENYQGKIQRNAVSTVFSVSKSLTALLCGIAIDEGYIKSVNDPVTDYLPELRKADPRFARLTIEHLLDMRAGLKFNENYSFNPFSAMARLHYGRNMLRQMKHLKFEEEPGTSFRYCSMVTAILGIVIERAVGRSYADYMSEKVWKPLGMEDDALMSVDAVRKRYPRSYGGISTTARDLAKVGRLYLNHGCFDGRQIVDSAWVETTLSAVRAHNNTQNAIRGYSYSWWHERRPILNEDGTSYLFIDKESAMQRCRDLGFPDATVGAVKGTDKYRAFRDEEFPQMVGMLGQVVYIDSSRNLILVILTNRELASLIETVFDSLDKH